MLVYPDTTSTKKNGANSVGETSRPRRTLLSTFENTTLINSFTTSTKVSQVFTTRTLHFCQNWNQWRIRRRQKERSKSTTGPVFGSLLQVALQADANTIRAGCYFYQLSGTLCTRKLFEIHFWAIFNLFSSFQLFCIYTCLFRLKRRKKYAKSVFLVTS